MSIDKNNRKETILYCHKQKTGKYNKSLGDHWYNDFYPHPEVCRLADKSRDVYKVKVREIKEGEKSIYWAWWSNEDNKFIFVQAMREILQIYFPYGIEAEVEKGKGKDYNVIIEEFGIAEKSDK